MEVLTTITRLKEELGALRPISTEQEQRIMQKFRLDWNYHSNHIEGNSLTYGETKALILFGITAQGKPLKDHLEMTGHNEVLKLLEDVVKEERPLSEAFIRELHVLLLKEPYYVDAITPDGSPARKLINVGSYKETPNHVRTATGEMFYFATPEETPAKMTDLIDWYREKSASGELHPLLLAAEFHYKFVRIHPFDDGNGRMARILMNFILMQHGYPPVIIKTDEKGDRYFPTLQQADAGIIEPFIQYIGESLEHSLQLMIRGAKGESIEEADDVDKEIALLEQRLKGRGKAYTKLKDKEIVTEVIEKVFLPIREQFINLTKNIASYYFEYTTGLSGVGKSVVFTLPDGSVFSHFAIPQLVDILLKYALKNNKIETEFVFRSFNLNNIPPFDYGIKFRLSFSETHYTLTIINNQYNKVHEIPKKYDVLLTPEEIKAIAGIAAKAHTDFIQQKLEEAESKT